MGLRQLDESDSCVFVYDDPTGKEIFAVGIYVDNLQIVHSAELDEQGEAIDPDSFYAKFVSRLRSDWDVIDEGPMSDLLGVEVDYQQDGSVLLHQAKYVKKMIERFYPSGLPTSASKCSLPFTPKLGERIRTALDCRPINGATLRPELVTEFQQKIGSLMYACTATRCDIAFPVHQLCQCMTCPTDDLMLELDCVFGYLSKNASLGLRFSPSVSELEGFSDASFEERNSTSGWLVLWQNAPLAWGSRKQKSISLSSCESEIYALSEAAKDMWSTSASSCAGSSRRHPMARRFSTATTRRLATSRTTRSTTTRPSTSRVATSSCATWSRPSSCRCRSSPPPTTSPTSSPRRSTPSLSSASATSS